MSDGSSGPAWGRVDQSVMRDPALSIEAKGIFAYLCSFADEEGKCYPGIETILSEIGMSKTRYYKYLAELKKCNLIRVEAGQRRQGSFPRNTYYINQSFPQFKETAPIPKFQETSKTTFPQNRETPFPQNRETAVSSNCGAPFPENKETNTSYNTPDINTSAKNTLKRKTQKTEKDAAIATIREILNSRRWRRCLQLQGGYIYLHKPNSLTWDDVISAAHEYIAQFPEPTPKKQNDVIQWYYFSDYLSKWRK